MRSTRSKQEKLTELNFAPVKGANRTARNKKTKDDENTVSPSKRCSPPKMRRSVSGDNLAAVKGSPLRPTNSPGKRAMPPCPNTAPLPSTYAKTTANHSTTSKAKQKLSFDNVAAEKKVQARKDIDSQDTLNSRLSIAQRKLGLGTPDELVCREEEKDIIEAFLHKSLFKHQPASMYISGPPGTGKTACIKHTLRKHEKENFEQVYINCMNVRTAASINKELYMAVKKVNDAPAQRVIMNSIKKLLTENANMILVVLDEIDQLETKSHDVLYAAFGWCDLPSSRVVLIGIANSLDLTERSLPKLKIELKIQPQLLHYKPYSTEQVSTIIKHRLIEADNLLRPEAVELCARKISAKTGDIRTALHLCQKALHLFMNKPVKEEDVGKSRSVGCGEILAAVNDVFGQKLVDRRTNLPLQQKLILAALVVMTHNLKQTNVTLNQLFSAYKKGCVASRVPHVESWECANMLSLLETQGLVSVANCTRKSNPLLTVKLRVDVTAAREALCDQTMVDKMFDALKK